MTNIALETLEDLRLPQLQALFAEVTGQTTKAPNKKYLIKRIREALAEQAEEIFDEELATEQAGSAELEPTPEPVEDAQGAEPAEEAQDAEPAGDAQDAEPAEKAQDAEPAEEAAETTEEPTTTEDTPLSKRSVAELQALYLEVVGRPTGSSHKRYLIWKIREAQKGRIPVGPRTRRSPSEPAAEHMVLPVRMETSLVQRLDEARERLGLKNRMDLFRKALAAYMTNAGETELAADLLPEA